jgi:hypothetical protein
MRFGNIYLHKPRFGNLFYAAQWVHMLPTTAASQAIKLCKELQGVHMPVIEQYQLLPVNHVITPE